MSLTLSHSQLRDARDWLAENTWADMDPSDFATLPDDKIEAGIAAHYSGGVAAFVCAESEPEPEAFTSPADVATALCDAISLSDLMHAGAPERGRYRGFAALGELDDHNQLAINHGMPELNGTPERIDLINTYADAISAEIISRYVTAIREGRKGAA